MTYRQMLKDEYLLRKSKNSVTKKEFAKSIGLSPSFLGRILDGKRNIGEKKAFDIAARLWNKESKKINLFCQQASVARSQSEDYEQYYLTHTEKTKPSKITLKPEVFRSLYHWHNLAILCLFYLKDFRWDIKWMSNKLNLSPMVVEVALERLKQAKVINEKDQSFSPSNLNHEFKDTPSKYIRTFHTEMLEKAQIALTEQDYDKRSITGAMIAVNSSKIKEANERIGEFRKELAELLSTGERDTVYHLNINLFQVDQS